jgi:hypothetical protein
MMMDSLSRVCASGSSRFVSRLLDAIEAEVRDLAADLAEH